MFQVEYQKDKSEPWQPVCKTAIKASIIPHYDHAKKQAREHGGRELWAPLVRFTESQRNELLKRAGFEPLPHRSKECSPCVHANRRDFSTWTKTESQWSNG